MSNLYLKTTASTVAFPHVYIDDGRSCYIAFAKYFEISNVLLDLCEESLQLSHNHETSAASLLLDAFQSTDPHPITTSRFPLRNASNDER